MNEKEEIEFLMTVVHMCYLSHKYLKAKKRTWWVRPLYQERSKRGFFQTTFKSMKKNDPELFFKSTRMNMMQYNLLLSLVKQSLTKRSIRRPIDPECRMVLTIMYLSQGRTPNYLARSFRMGVSTVRKIIMETCQVFWEVLSPVYMPQLNTCGWKNIAKEFNDRLNMPNCVGSIDGKHIKIKCPPNTGSTYFNHKGYYSLVLLAICDANYIFTAVDVGAFGSQGDSKIFRNSIVGQKIFSNDVNLPPPEKLPESETITPHYFVGDSRFPLLENLMRPYPGSLLNKPEEVFNFRLSRAQRVVENSFGILVARWRVLLKCIEFRPNNADKIILACTILHNFLKITDGSDNLYSYCPEHFCDTYTEDGARIDGMWRQESGPLLSIRRCGSNNRAEGASQVRQQLTSYFLNEGKVPFQP